MTDDIVARLRKLAKMWNVDHVPNYYDAAADEIEQLRAALLQIAETPDHYTPHMVRTHAHAALEGEKKNG